MESVFPQQPNIRELGQATKLIDFVVNVDDFLVELLPFVVNGCSRLIDGSNLFFQRGECASISVAFAFLFILFLSLLFLLRKLFLFFFDLPDLVFSFLLLLQQLVFHLVVVSEEEYLPVDESFASVCFEAHIDQKYDVVEELIVALRHTEHSFFQLMT